MSKTEAQPEYALAQRDRTSYPWYVANIGKYLVPVTQKLLSEYSHVPLQEQSKHIHDMRDRAFAIRSYPCTGLGVFLLPFIPHTPVYSTILSRLKQGATLVDVACFMGTDIRQLAFDGAPTGKMFGVDIVSHWEVGYDMYRDRKTFQATFIEADIMSSDERLLALQGQVDVVGISAVLHQFDLETQVAVCKTLIGLSREGCQLFGYQIGTEIGGEEEKMGPKVFSHSPETFIDMFKRVADETTTQWAVSCDFLEWATLGWDVADMAWLQGKKPISFVAERRL